MGNDIKWLALVKELAFWMEHKEICEQSGDASGIEEAKDEMRGLLRRAEALHKEESDDE
jgi:hypothetical protein